MLKPSGRSVPPLAVFLWGLLLLCVFISPQAKAIRCADGEHNPIDLDGIKLQYHASSFSLMLNRLSGSGIKLEPKTLQVATTATQQWNEYLKGLVIGYNSCAVSQKEYQEGLQKIYPSLRSDAGEIEALVRQMPHQSSVDLARLDALLASYEKKLNRFAILAKKDVDYQRIANIVEGVAQTLNVQAAERDKLINTIDPATNG